MSAGTGAGTCAGTGAGTCANAGADTCARAGAGASAEIGVCLSACTRAVALCRDMRPCRQPGIIPVPSALHL